jgi:hypothetical protein
MLFKMRLLSKQNKVLLGGTVTLIHSNTGELKDQVVVV